MGQAYTDGLHGPEVDDAAADGQFPQMGVLLEQGNKYGPGLRLGLPLHGMLLPDRGGTLDNTEGVGHLVHIL